MEEPAEREVSAMLVRQEVREGMRGTADPLA
jgi:hypothetical protein